LDKIEEIGRKGREEENFSRLNAIRGAISARDESDYDPLFGSPRNSQNPQNLQKRERKKEAKKEREKRLLFLHLKNLRNWSRQWGPPPVVTDYAYKSN